MPSVQCVCVVVSISADIKLPHSDHRLDGDIRTLISALLNAVAAFAPQLYRTRRMANPWLNALNAAIALSAVSRLLMATHRL
ncbi:hypothetical protein ASF73_10990 [Xanthomonas sp. Leaf131]|nr:hypothetical protein ASF73_10990 [Xanthomonas sp. Leaf131]